MGSGEAGAPAESLRVVARAVRDLAGRQGIPEVIHTPADALPGATTGHVVYDLGIALSLALGDLSEYLDAAEQATETAAPEAGAGAAPAAMNPTGADVRPAPADLPSAGVATPSPAREHEARRHGRRSPLAVATTSFVHPWMRRPGRTIADVAAQLDGHLARLTDLMGAAAALLPAGTYLASTDGVVAAVAGARAAFAGLADAMDEHGPAVADLDQALGSAPPWRWRHLRGELRARTDALSAADTTCRRLLEQAVRDVPDTDAIVAGTGWVTGLADHARAADLRGDEPVADIRGALSQMPAARLAAILRLRPDLVARLVADPAPPEDRPADSLSDRADDETSRAWRQVRRAAGDGATGYAAADGGATDGGATDGGATDGGEIDGGAADGGASDAGAVGSEPRAAAPSARDRLLRVQAVRETFAALSPDLARRVALLHPRRLGVLDGAPVELRVEANRLHLRAALGSARRSDVDLEARAVARRALDGRRWWRRLSGVALDAWLSRDALTSWANVDTDRPLLVRADLRIRVRLYQSLLYDRGPRRLLTFDPTGRGRLAELWGAEPGRARFVVVFVPGTGTAVRGFHLPTDVAARMARAGGPDTCVLAWMGADFPYAMGTDAPFVRYAARAAAPLCAAVEALDVRRDAIVTVVGHSYGGVMVGAAERLGLPADRVVHLASAGAGPGVDALEAYPDVDPLGRPRHVERWSLTAPGDPITYVRAAAAPWRRLPGALATWTERLLRPIGLGVDPADLPGTHVVEAGTWEEDSGSHHAGEALRGRSAHAGVFAHGTTSFRRVVEIATAPSGPN